MDLSTKYLDEWFKAFSNFRELPDEYNYPGYYGSVSDELNKWIHPYVNSGAMLNDNGYLTDHGPKHVKMVIKRASEFLNNGPDINLLTPFEVLILLLSIQIHDVGNIFGRNNHELNSEIIIRQIGEGVSRQHKVIWDYVYAIAKAHKGNEIQKLNIEEYYLGQVIRPQFIAAILKFADELAEDRTRADRYNLISGNISKNRPEAELFHQYALALHSLSPDTESRSIKFFFNIEGQLAKRTFFKKLKDGSIKECYLLDEIYLRTLKAHYERLYCMRFMRPEINFDLITVTIRIKLDNRKSIDKTYELIEMGLEQPKSNDFYSLCPKLTNFTGKIVSDKLTKGTLI